jgi:hypothetical protein
MIDPFSALAAVNTAIKLVKFTVSTVKNLESLGPCLSQFFTAKENAIAVIKQGGFKGSAMGQAIELEMAIESAKNFEREIADLFFSANEVDLFKRIKARAASITSDKIKAERRLNEARARRSKEIDELVVVILILAVTAGVIGTVGWFVWEAIRHCQPYCGR